MHLRNPFGHKVSFYSIIRSCIFIHLVVLYLLIGELKPLIFKAIVDKQNHCDYAILFTVFFVTWDIFQL